MNKKCLLLMCSVVMMACSNGKNEVILDSFEGEISRKTVDYGAGADTYINVTASSEIKFCGKQSLKLEYDRVESSYMFCARGYGLDVLGATWEGKAPDKIKWDKYNAVSLQVYGNNNGKTIAFDVKDVSGEIYRHTFIDNFKGWQEVVISLVSIKVREDWQPKGIDGNKQLNFPLKAFQFEVLTVGQGTVYFDCVKMIQNN